MKTSAQFSYEPRTTVNNTAAAFDYDRMRISIRKALPTKST